MNLILMKRMKYHSLKKILLYQYKRKLCFRRICNNNIALREILWLGCTHVSNFCLTRYYTRICKLYIKLHNIIKQTTVY